MWQALFIWSSRISDRLCELRGSSFLHPWVQPLDAPGVPGHQKEKLRHLAHQQVPHVEHRELSSDPVLWGQRFGALRGGVQESAEPADHVGSFGPMSRSFSAASGSTVAQPPGSGRFQIPKGWLVNLSLPRFCPEKTHVLSVRACARTHMHTES